MGKPRGKLISFEGGRSAGKSTQVKLLAKRLENAGYPVLVAYEQEGSVGAKAIRHMLSSGAASSFGNEMEAILAAATIGDHVEQVIKPALDNGINVLCESYCDAFEVNQGIIRDADENMIKAIGHVIFEEAWPDLTFILDIFPEEGMRRSNQNHKNDAAGSANKVDIVMQKARHAGYHKIAREAAGRCEVIDASLRQSYVAEKVWEALARRDIFVDTNPTEKTVVANNTNNSNETVVADLTNKTIVLGASK